MSHTSIAHTAAQRWTVMGMVEHYREPEPEMKWISVKERLPECDQVVMCYKADRGVRIGKHLAATYADGVSAFKDCCGDYAFGATHWMPLPEPPRELDPAEGR